MTKPMTDAREPDELTLKAWELDIAAGRYRLQKDECLWALRKIRRLRELVAATKPFVEDRHVRECVKGCPECSRLAQAGLYR